MKQVLAVLVLYKLKAEDSPAFRALTSFLGSGRAGSEALEFVVCDNNPFEQPAPANFAGRYLRDLTNPGLAKPYNAALHLAEAEGIPWLMLLDQDTVITAEYLEEVFRKTADFIADHQIAALVPRLMMGTQRLSPHLPRFQSVSSSFAEELPNPKTQGTRLEAYNSGAVLKVNALREVGGFPERYWLDYLDHATFHALQDTGRQVVVLDSRLEHDLSAKNSETERGAAYAARLENILDAGLGFYQEYGSSWNRLLYRIDLLRQLVGTLRRGWFQPAKSIVRVALRGRAHSLSR